MDSVRSAHTTSGHSGRFSTHHNPSGKPGDSPTPKQVTVRKRTLLDSIANATRNSAKGSETRRALMFLTGIVEGCESVVESWHSQFTYLTSPGPVLVDKLPAYVDGNAVMVLPTFGQWAAQLSASERAAHRELITATRYHAVHGDLLARAQLAQAKATGDNRPALDRLVLCIATLCDSTDNLSYWETQLAYLTTPQSVYKLQGGGDVETELNPEFTGVGCGKPFRITAKRLPGLRQWAWQLSAYVREAYPDLADAGNNFASSLERMGTSPRTTKGTFARKLAN